MKKSVSNFKRTAKILIQKTMSIFPVQDIIMFESRPDCAGSVKAVFDELVRRNLNKRYKLIWRMHEKPTEKLKKPQNVYYIHKTFLLTVIGGIAKLFISENGYFYKCRGKQQYLFHIFHGGSFKNVKRHYPSPENLDEVISLSPYLLSADAENYNCRAEILHPIGFPRNDTLLEKERDLHYLFQNCCYEKLIYWLPTYRQHKTDKSAVHSSISMPIIHQTEDAIRINKVAEDNHVLIVVKPHFAQDLSKIRNINLGNLIFINDTFLQVNHIGNYNVLNASDALISDYSSVYYDYLIKNKPIGLCWEDFDEYERTEGFIVDPNVVMAGGEKIYTIDELCAFITRVAKGEDKLADKRLNVRKLIFPDGVRPCTSVVADRIEQILEEL